MKRKRVRTLPAYTSRCDSCIRLKTKCTGVFPCSQCFALCQQCLPMQGSVAPDTPYIDLALSRLDPRTLAEPMIQAFFSLSRTASIKPDEATLVLRMWRTMCLHAGADVTHGMFQVSMKTLGIHPLALESEADRLLDRKPALSMSEMEKRKGTVVEEIRRSQTFRSMDDGRTCMIVMHLDPDLGMTVTTNGAAAKLFASAEEVNNYIDKQKVIFSYLIASMIDPSDRQQWFELQMASVCALPARPTALIKFCNREGRIDLYILKYRIMRFPEFPGQGFRVVTLERAPNSRHVTERPSRRYRIVDAFRQGRTDDDAPAAAGDEDESIDSTEAWRGDLPGLACLPLPLPGDIDSKRLLAPAPPMRPFTPRPPLCPPPASPPMVAGAWEAYPPGTQQGGGPWVKDEVDDPLLGFNPEDEKLLQELLFELPSGGVEGGEGLVTDGPVM